MKINTLLSGAALLSSVAPASGFSLFEDLASFSSLELPGSPHHLLQSVRRKTKEYLGANDISVLSYDSDPAYSLRVRSVDPSKLGVDTVKQWSGYLDYEDSKHFFYWFFESRNDPKNDPIILWLNGGPGCSSFTGMLFELGPSSIGPDLKPIHNPYSWNNNASVIFLEQPLGVGFSYGDEKVTTSKLAAKDAYIFLELFFKQFPHLRGNDFHIAGESYAGHYIPQIAHEIVVENPDRSFNLTSVMIGNGITDTLTQSDYYQPMACGEGGYKPVLSEAQCDKMTRDAKKCKLLNTACYMSQRSIPCFLAMTVCNSVLMDPYSDTGLNVYDIRGPCENPDFGMCYNGLQNVEEYMNLDYVQDALGSDVHNYTGCSDDVFSGFAFTGDEAKPFHQFIAELLDRDIPVLIYAGDKDFICNWLGNHAWTDRLEWRDHETYEEIPLSPWKHSETLEEVGQVKNFGPLTFLRVYDAGHMVPYDQPEASLEMVNQWISKLAIASN